MSQSESTTNLAIALAKAQAKFDPITKNRIGQEGNQKFPYSTLSQVLDAVRPSLNSEGIFLSQPVIVDSNGNQRVTTRVQLGDEFIQTDGIMLSPGLVGSKKLGLEITYSKRYDLISFLGVCAEDDDKDAPDLKSDKPSSAPKPSFIPAKTTTNAVLPKATSFEYGANQQARTITPSGTEITDADLPDFPEPEKSNPLPADAAEVADHLLNFVPLTEARNTEIQNRLKDLVANKTVGRRDLSLFLEDQHSGKKQFDVDAKQWEGTIAKIEAAIADGTIKALLKTKKA